MSSRIEYDDLLALTTACSMDSQSDQLTTAELQAQLSNTLYHIAQSQRREDAIIAPATTPTTPSSAWKFDQPSCGLQRNSSFGRSPSYPRIQSHVSQEAPEADEMMMDDEEMYAIQTPRSHSTSHTLIAHKGFHPGLSPEINMDTGLSQSSFPARRHSIEAQFSMDVSPTSLFATSDPFFIATLELQAANKAKRQLQSKPYCMSTPLQFSSSQAQFQAIPVQNTSNAIGVDPTLLQYR